MQRALIQYRNPKNYDLVHEALVKAGRTDLIGFDKKCLIRPRSARPGARPPAKPGKPAAKSGRPAGKPEAKAAPQPAARQKPKKRGEGWARPKPKPGKKR